ncbi:hypothetical protein BDN72DRAFT_873519 [Pluteus cervinus]|uniref:Uncharacterized protein n=1 Tax=Pluteus cervinus TaxID=181527 RepID=A0ACD3BHF4_9AGAR|nr:hypothetical protein BDN72DRAFT_873519 [Pluteus cervinus]
MQFIATTSLYTFTFTILFALFPIMPTMETLASPVALHALGDPQHPALPNDHKNPPRPRYYDDDDDCPDPERNFHYLSWSSFALFARLLATHHP